MRNAAVNRKTKETDIRLFLELDGTGKSRIATGCGFLDHMLTLFASHGRFDLVVGCRGDKEVDFHHTVEDVGIALGTAFSKALGEKRGITRYGSFLLPMDEALVTAAVDLSGRAYLAYSVYPLTEKVGDFDTELAQEFWAAFVRCAECALHLRQDAGVNSHHILEASFKAAARALKQAVAIDPVFANEIPSTKGVL